MKNNKEIKMNNIKLNSVGSIIDTKTNMVYPQNIDGTPDLNCGGYLEDSCEEWFDSLDKKDKEIVDNLIK